MDRMVQTALSSLKGLQDLKFDLANNLANVNVPGFRKDLPNEGNAGFLSALNQATARVFPLETGDRIFSNETGQLQNTGVETDVALLNEAFLFIQPTEGDIALSKRGDFAIDGLNQLVNGAGDVVLSDGLAPIVLPAFSELKVSENGEILVQEPGSVPGDFTSIAFLGTATGSPDLLTKSLDGRIRNLSLIHISEPTRPY